MYTYIPPEHKDFQYVTQSIMKCVKTRKNW